MQQLLYLIYVKSEKSDNHVRPLWNFIQTLSLTEKKLKFLKGIGLNKSFKLYMVIGFKFSETRSYFYKTFVIVFQKD